MCEMFRVMIGSLALCLVVLGTAARPAMAEASPNSASATSGGTASNGGKIALAEVEPVLIYQFRRYQKFYGDENTARGASWRDPTSWAASAARAISSSIGGSSSMCP